MKRFFKNLLFLFCMTVIIAGCASSTPYRLTIQVSDSNNSLLNNVGITVLTNGCSQSGQTFTGANGVGYVDLDCTNPPQGAKIILQKTGYSTFTQNEGSVKAGQVYSYVLQPDNLPSGLKSTATLPPNTQNSPTQNEPTLTSPQVPMSGVLQLAFVREVNGVPQIFLTDKNETFTQQITSMDDGACQPAWKPDGTEIVFISPCNRRLDEYDDTSLYRISVPADPQEISPRQGDILLTPSGGAYEPAWSVNGIIYTGKEDGTRRQIYRIADPDRPTSDLLSNPSSEEFGGSFSSDGINVIAFRVLPGFGENLLYWVPFTNFRMDISNNWIVKQNFGEVREPAWQPNGDLIVFVHKNQIWTSVIKTRKTNQVTSLVKAGSVHDPDWSADGKFIAFSVDKSTTDYDIWYVPLSGKPAKPIAVTLAPEYQPAWRPFVNP